MLTKAYSLKFLTETFSFEKNEKKNIITFNVPLEIIGDTGKKYSIEARIKGLIPPIEEENTFISISETFLGRGSAKYEEECKYQLSNKTSEALIDIKFRNLHEEKFIGAFYDRIERKYKPLYFKFKHVTEYKPIAIEKRDDNNIYYFKIKEKYYKTVCNHLKDAVNGKNIDKERNLLNKINAMIPHYAYNVNDLYKKEPFKTYLYKDVYPLDYIGNKIGFNREYQENKHKSHYYRMTSDNIIINVTNEYQRYYKTLNEFLYSMENYFPNIKDKIKVFDKNLLGEELQKFNIGDKVTVSNPTEKRKSIRNFEGIITDKVYRSPKVTVKFFDYFEEEIEPNELILCSNSAK